MFWSTIFPASLLIAQASASYDAMMGAGVMREDAAVLERRMEYFGADQVAHIITKRQSSGSAVLNQDGTINMTAWDETANAACYTALTKLPESSNPSGTCVCYNLPAMNNVTGAFEADLRLYQLSTPSGQFAGIPQQNIQVGLTYRGASVSPISAAAASKMVLTRQTQTTTNSLKLLQTYLFVGQIDKAQMSESMNMATLEALVMPTVTLSAVNSAGQTVSTNVSSNEAAFVAGVFSNSIVMSDFSVANMAVDTAMQGLRNGTVPFVLPGVVLMIFPVGLVITSIWTVLLVAAVGYGTFERIGFREQFRSRTQRAGKAAQARI